ncbi:metal-dependent hydrolase [Haladaptatus salinisoli]|uniref:metal-dependent hydrolase n=1 Tax=Haladaptatus salinisoli TaxID=2884876 RepID=UPI001D0B4A12|nr:metal-dependent hydrolase [Haladaptatus salinisoli]
MWPWGHLAFGYLAYSLVAHRWRGRPPDGREAIVVAIATQFPDIVDKPLAWTVPILPSGRSFAHSLLTASIIVTFVTIYCRRTGREGALAFCVGYFSHIVGDAFGPLLAGEYVYLTFLLWPVLPVRADTEPSFAAHFESLLSLGFSAPELLLVAVTILLWVSDGVPGLSEFLDVLPRPNRW